MEAIKKISQKLGPGCPFWDGQPPQYPGQPSPAEQEAYYEALKKIDWENVKKDLRAAFRQSQDFFPADYGHYGPFFIRMAWHAAGTYRMSDGRGGADGGCQRLEPELSWDDNTNLIHAHKLLEPIKTKYGLGLSWGDLIVLAGTTAFEDMGCPMAGFAAGRIDHADNSQSIGLGPSPQQERFQKVEINGQAPAPLGQNTMELIYVNPAGPMGEPDPQGAADTIRDVFGRMGMDDRENVALIGGGHSIGKCHGAGTEGPGPKPRECPWNPYPGAHGSGRGNDTVTSGFEGPWTTKPTQMDNEYFKNLVNYEWEKYESPGGNWQWKVKDSDSPEAPAAQGDGKQHIIMLTTDVALATDPEYRKYVEEFAADEKAFFEAFAAVWYKLMNRDMGPVSRLVGPAVAKPQDWQFPLPDPPAKLANMKAVCRDIEKLIQEHPDKKSKLVRLALNSAHTYRHTDYQGGCNGARIRFSPGKDWKVNEGLDVALTALEPIKTKYGDGLSWADLIVLAANVTVVSYGAPKDLPFCPGRTDDTSGEAWETLAYTNAEPAATIEQLEDRIALNGLSKKEFVALSLPFFHTVADLKAMMETKKDDEDIWTKTLKYHPDFQRHVENYIAAGDDVYKKDFAFAWTKLMNADRFEGPIHRISPH